MQVGKLDHRIEIKTLVETNTGGEVVRSYTSHGTFYAYVKSARGKEAIEAARMNARSIIRVMMRYDSAISVRDQIIWESQTYNIIEVDRTGIRKGELWLSAECVGYQ
jgi:SPP1 family predicted phage head-tail adaptor